MERPKRSFPDRPAPARACGELAACILLPLALAISLTGSIITMPSECGDLDRPTGPLAGLNTAWMGAFYTCTILHVMVSALKISTDLYRICSGST
jgi:hypothetical protein